MENQQIKTGFVLGIEENRVSIQLMPTLSGECGTSCRCKALSMIEEARGPRIWIKGNYKQQLKLNDFVIVEANLPSPYIGIFFLFILPILGLFFGSFFGNALALEYSSTNQQIFSIIGAAAGFSLAMGTAMLLDYKIQRKKEIFKIREIPSLSAESHKECKNIQKAFNNENK